MTVLFRVTPINQRRKLVPDGAKSEWEDVD